MCGRALLTLLAPVLGLVLFAGVVLVGGACGTDRGPVYTVSALTRHLMQHPDAWVGRTVRVRGAFWDCNPTDVPPAFCLAAGPTGEDALPSVDPLSLVIAPADPLRATLRRLPILRSLVPPAQVPHWDTTAIYSVQLRVQTGVYCGAPVCFEALLLDAAPDAAGAG